MPPNPAHHIAALGFATYVLLKLYGARGIALAGFLGGLVNSTVTVTELSNRVREWNGVFGDAAFRGVVLATCAMLVRNGVILAIFAPAAFRAGLLPLALMLVGTGAALIGTADGRHRPGAADRADPSRQPLPTLESPFSPMAALKFGAAFLVLQIAGTLAERSLGSAGSTL